MIDPRITRIRDDVKQRYPQVRDLGVYNCRHKNNNPSLPWSKHSWGEAWDISTPWWPTSKTRHYIYIDQIVAYLRSRWDYYDLLKIVWRTTLHWDHCHLEVIPERGDSIPPCAGGPPDQDEDDMTVEQYVSGLTPDRIDQLYAAGLFDGDPAYWIGLLSNPADPEWIGFLVAVDVNAKVKGIGSGPSYTGGTFTGQWSA